MEESIQYFSDHPIELWGTIFGLICVYLNTKENIWAWPTGLISVGLYIYIFLEANLIGDFLLHIVYVILGLYGWWHWYFGSDQVDSLPISSSSKNELYTLLTIGTLGTFLMGYIFEHYLNSSLPYWDAFTTSFSLVAQWQLAKKRIENWILWIVVDVVCVGVYYHKGLMITVALYAIYLVLASKGYYDWKKTYNKQQKTLIPAQ